MESCSNVLAEDPVILELLRSCEDYKGGPPIAFEFRGIIEKFLRNQVIGVQSDPCNYNAIKSELIVSFGKHEFDSFKAFMQATLKAIDSRVSNLAHVPAEDSISLASMRSAPIPSGEQPTSADEISKSDSSTFGAVLQDFMHL